VGHLGPDLARHGVCGRTGRAAPDQRLIDYGVTPSNMQVIVSTTLIIAGGLLLDALTSLGNTLLAVRVAQYWAPTCAARFPPGRGAVLWQSRPLADWPAAVRLTNDVTRYRASFSCPCASSPGRRCCSSAASSCWWSPVAVGPADAGVVAHHHGLIVFNHQPRSALFLQVQRRLDNLTPCCKKPGRGAGGQGVRAPRL
jgi:hypothetical protein